MVFRFKVGTLELTVLTDGTFAFPARERWPDAPGADLDKMLAESFQSVAAPVLQVNVLAVNTGDRLVLIDAGTGGLFPADAGTTGRMPTSLAAAGIRPEDVDTVILTHAHPDHLWGAVDETFSQRIYPNADFVIAQAEWDYWMAPERAESEFVTSASLRLLEPRLRYITPGAEPVSGIMSIDAAGHTPGHMALHIVSGSEELVCAADVITDRAVSFQRPDWHLRADIDRAQGAKMRQRFLDRLATDRTLVAAYHLPFPGVGHVVRDGAAFRWVPADWGWQL